MLLFKFNIWVELFKVEHLRCQTYPFVVKRMELHQKSFYKFETKFNPSFFKRWRPWNLRSAHVILKSDLSRKTMRGQIIVIKRAICKFMLKLKSHLSEIKVLSHNAVNNLDQFNLGLKSDLSISTKWGQIVRIKRAICNFMLELKSYVSEIKVCSHNAVNNLNQFNIGLSQT